MPSSRRSSDTNVSRIGGARAVGLTDGAAAYRVGGNADPVHVAVAGLLTLLPPVRVGIPSPSAASAPAEGAHLRRIPAMKEEPRDHGVEAAAPEGRAGRTRRRGRWQVRGRRPGLPPRTPATDRGRGRRRGGPGSRPRPPAVEALAGALPLVVELGEVGGEGRVLQARGRPSQASSRRSARSTAGGVFAGERVHGKASGARSRGPSTQASSRRSARSTPGCWFGESRRPGEASASVRSPRSTSPPISVLTPGRSRP